VISSTLPEPVPGLVIHYSYLWLAEHRRGMEEGRKDRPCAIVLTVFDDKVGKIVTALPITHTPPAKNDLSIEIPTATKQRLKLDAQRSWIVLSEANQFVWPGPDLRPSKRGDMSTVAAGLLPVQFFHQVRTAFASALRERRAQAVPRTQ
jgi:hypothetical protein